MQQTSDGGYILGGSSEISWGATAMYLVKTTPDWVPPPPEQVVIRIETNQAILHWSADGSPHYRIYSSDDPGLTDETLEGSTSDTTFTITNLSGARRFYHVRGSWQP